MAESIEIATFENGKLRIATEGGKNREVVLALPLERLLVGLVRVPSDCTRDPAAFATPVLQAMSPYPDEPLSVSCEQVQEDATGSVFIAAALPESSAEDIGEQLDANSLNVKRVDALVFGQLRELWSAIDDGRKGLRRAVLIGGEAISMIVLDGDLPVAIRAICRGGDFRREVMFSLLQAEEFGGAKELAEIVVAGEVDCTSLETLAPVRALPSLPDGLAGVAERAVEEGTIDALPASWREVLEETRFKAKFKRNLSIAVGLWLVFVGVIFGVPFVYGLMADHQKALSREHAKKYREVDEMRSKVMLVRKYSDHRRGALEILKAISDRLPSDVELGNWNFRREDGVRFSGEADYADSVYALKEKLLAITFDEGEDGEGVTDDGDEARLFAEVVLTGPVTSGKSGRQKFDIDCRYAREEN